MFIKFPAVLLFLTFITLAAGSVSSASAEQISPKPPAPPQLNDVSTCYNGMQGLRQVATDCRQTMRTAIDSCLEANRNAADAVLACVGKSAAACQKTAFASTAERAAMCIDTEANIWAARLQVAYLALSEKIDREARRQMRSAYLSWKAHMDQTCQLRQTILSAPDAWIEVADCRLRMLARQIQEFRHLNRYLLAKRNK